MHYPKLNFTRLFTIFAIAFAIVSVLVFVKTQVQAASGVNRQINFQGKLVNNPSGTNVSDTSYTVVFTIYDNPSGGTALWTETQSITTADGIFRASLGSVTPIPSSFNFNWSDLYLGVKVNADSEMTPRVKLATVPFAFNAEKVSGLTVQDTSGAASTSGTLRVGNGTTVNLGTNDLTLTTSGATTVTFPAAGSITLVDEATSQTLTNKIIGSTGLTFTGANTDITTGTNQDFILFPNGIGRVGIFSTSGIAPLSSLDVRSNLITGGTISIASVSGRTSFAALVANNDLVAGDLFTASSSSQSRFTIKGNGQIIADAYKTCTLKTDSTGLITCSTDLQGSGSGGGAFTELEGAIVPLNSTEDFLIGGQATTSAQFAVLNIAKNQAVATVSGQFIVMPNNGWGGKVGIGTTNPVTKLQVVGGAIQLDDGQPIQFGSSNVQVSGVDNNLHLASWSRVRLYTDTDNAGNEDFEFYGNVARGTTTGALMVIKDVGNVGIGTMTTLASLDIRGFATQNGGTISVASASGKTSFAALVANNDLVTGDLFTASSSSQSRFTIKGNGQIIANAYQTCTLKTDSTGLFTCGTDLQGSGSGFESPFKHLDGTIIPLNSTEDFFIGGQSTQSAQFAVLDVAKNQAIATVSGNLIVMPNNGWGGKVGIGTTNPSKPFTVYGDTAGGVARIHRFSALTNAALGTYDILAESTGDMVDGFGVAQTFSIQDNAGVVNYIADIRAIRSGADTNGTLIFSTKNESTVAEKMRIDNFGKVGIGATSPLSTLDVRGTDGAGTLSIASVSGRTSFAALVANNDLVAGDLFTASSSSQSRFTIKGNGQIIADAYKTCTLKTDSTGLITCSTDLQGSGSGGGAFTELEGAIVPLNSTEDFLIGGQATAAAKFAIKGIATNAPVATLSALANGNGLVLSANTSTIQALRNNALIFGGDTTGDINFRPGTGMVFIGENEVRSGGLTFYSSGVGEGDPTITTDATGNLILSASTGTVEIGSGTGNISLEGDADTSIVASFIGVPAADMFQLTNSGQAVTATGVDGLAVSYVLGGSSAVTNNGITVDLTTTNNNASTVLRGINIGNITGQASATEVGLRVGTGWDTGIAVESGGITVDNAAAAIAIFTAKDNGTAVFTIADGGDITWAAATPTLTISAAETFTISNGTAADNFVYNTSTNALTIGDGTNGLTFDIDTGMAYQGTGRKTKKITLNAEYPGAILTASGSGTITGSMTSDASASAALSNYRTYYEWSSSETTALNDYTVVVRVKLPEDFGAWATTDALTISYNTELNGSGSNKLDVLVFNADTSLSASDQATPVYMRTNNISASNKTWLDLSIDDSALDSGAARDLDAAGDTAVIYLKMYSKDNNHVQIGDIVLSYLSTF